MNLSVLCVYQGKLPCKNGIDAFFLVDAISSMLHLAATAFVARAWALPMHSLTLLI